MRDNYNNAIGLQVDGKIYHYNFSGPDRDGCVLIEVGRVVDKGFYAKESNRELTLIEKGLVRFIRGSDGNLPEGFNVAWEK